MSTRSRTARLARAVLLAPLLTLVAPTLAHAAPAPGSSPIRVMAAVPAAAEPASGLETDKRTRPVAPGLTLTSFDRFDSAGWLRVDALTTDLSGRLAVDYVNSGEVTKDEPLRAAVDRSGAVAAINGDFFDINNSGAAQGIGIQSGQLVQSPVAGHNNAAAITADGLGRVIQVYFDGTATLPTGPVKLTQFNNMVQADGIGVFTALWGSYPRSRAVNGAGRVAEVSVVDGRVAQIGDAAGSGPIPAGTTILLGRDAGADALAALKPGDPVTVAYQPKASDGSSLHAAVGGGNVLVRDGVPQNIADPTLAPRSAVGFSADGRNMFLLTVDGRQVDSRGVTQAEMGRMMAELGADYALNIDGGGSSTLLARKPGAPAVQVENSPSDGVERAVPNGLAIYAPKGSGRLAGYWIEPAMNPDAAPGLAPVPGGSPQRVFAGLSRQLVTRGYDETYGPAEGDPYWWSVSPPNRGHYDGDGRFDALAPGEVTLTAHRGAVTGNVQLTVLGPLARITPTATRVGLPNAAGSGRFGVVGYDAQEREAPIEPGDVRLEYDTSLLKITPDGSGYFTVRARKDSGAGLVTVHVGKRTTTLAVTIGLTDQSVADFDDAASWTFTAARATGAVAPTTGHDGTGTALKLSYDFTKDTATRAAYANPPAQFTVAGQPQAFGMWIYGNGHGEWPSLNLVDGLGQQLVLRGPYVTWTGWKYVEMAVPAGTAYPLAVRRFYVAEVNAAAQYVGEVIIDDIVAKVPPPVELPEPSRLLDPVVVGDGDASGAPWRFAVMSDAQFVGRAPDSDIVARTRRTLREIKQAAPDFLLIDGDLVDEGNDIDLALAKRILDEELGGSLPYYYVPGNHEVMGSKIDNFRKWFGDTYRSFDHQGTRFITLDTSSLTVRGGGFEQIALLRRQLDAAATDPAIGSVVVVEHVPPRDPTPAKASQLNDRKEAALLERWLADFQHSTGKGAAFVGGHVGTFHASTVDGVPYVINGNSGKTPSTAADDGGFTGWSMFGVDPVDAGEANAALADPLREAPPWIRVEMRPHVDSIAVSAPAEVAPGRPVTVSATLTQGDRRVPVAYPVSRWWSASPNVYVGSDRAGLKPWHVAWFDPETERLTALRPSGSVMLAVTVNGVRAEATISLVPTASAAAASAAAKPAA